MLLPALNFPPDLLLKARGLRLVFFDVDGVLTDGGLLFTEEGETIKRFIGRPAAGVDARRRS